MSSKPVIPAAKITVKWTSAEEQRLFDLIKSKEEWICLFARGQQLKEKWKYFREVLLAFWPIQETDQNRLRWMRDAESRGLVIVQDGQWVPTSLWGSTVQNPVQGKIVAWVRSYGKAEENGLVLSEWKCLDDMPISARNTLRSKCPAYFQIRSLINHSFPEMIQHPSAHPHSRAHSVPSRPSGSPIPSSSNGIKREREDSTEEPKGFTERDDGIHWTVKLEPRDTPRLPPTPSSICRPNSEASPGPPGGIVSIARPEPRTPPRYSASPGARHHTELLAAVLARAKRQSVIQGSDSTVETMVKSSESEEDSTGPATKKPKLDRSRAHPTPRPKELSITIPSSTSAQGQLDLAAFSSPFDDWHGAPDNPLSPPRPPTPPLSSVETTPLQSDHPANHESTPHNMSLDSTTRTIPPTQPRHFHAPKHSALPYKPLSVSSWEARRRERAAEAFSHAAQFRREATERHSTENLDQFPSEEILRAARMLDLPRVWLNQRLLPQYHRAGHDKKQNVLNTRRLDMFVAAYCRRSQNSHLPLILDGMDVWLAFEVRRYRELSACLSRFGARVFLNRASAQHARGDLRILIGSPIGTFEPSVGLPGFRTINMLDFMIELDNDYERAMRR